MLAEVVGLLGAFGVVFAAVLASPSAAAKPAGRPSGGVGPAGPAAGGPGRRSPGSTRIVVRAPIDRPADLEALLTAGFDVVALLDDAPGDAAEVWIDPLDWPRLRRVAPGAAIADTSPDRAPAWKAAPPAAGPPGFGQGAMGGYYTLSEVGAVLDHYAQTYPGVVGPKTTIGTSVEGRPIWAIKVSDHPTISEAEPRVLVDALHHAREPTSMQTALLLLDRLATGYATDPDVRALVDAREVWIVPVVNPDGYAFNEATHPQGGGPWRKNRRALPGGCFGVDLNRNYPFQWGVDDVGSSPNPCSDAYRGPAPLSEPESAALDAFVASQAIDTVCSLHAHGRLVMHPFGYAPVQPAAGEGYAEHAAEIADPSGYVAGSVQQVLGMPANGNAVDHHHAVHGARAWSLEVGGAFWPPVAEMVATAEENQEALLRLIRYAGAWLEPQDVEVVELIGDGDGFPDPGESLSLLVDVRARGVDPAGTATTLTIVSPDPALVVKQSSTTLPAAPPFSTSSVAPGALRFDVAPGTPAGTRIALSLTLQWDASQVTRPVIFDVGAPRAILRDDAESDLGWSFAAPGDDAFTGRWLRADPLPVIQDGQLAQPDDDATPGSGKRCFVTGNANTVPGGDDVDDGTTTLTSPRIDLTWAHEPRLRYARFYWCSKADDPFRVEVSANDGASWVPLETVLGRRNQWTAREWRIEDFVPRTAAFRVRFIATDPTNDSVTEALVDDLEIVDFGAAPHLGLMGTPKLGGLVELQLDAPAGGPVWLLAAAGPGSAKVPGVAGSLLLDPASLVVVGALVAPVGDLVRIPVAVPSAPALSGASAWVQAVQATAPAFSGAVAVTIP